MLCNLFIFANLVNEQRHFILNHVSLITSEVKYTFMSIDHLNFIFSNLPTHISFLYIFPSHFLSLRWLIKCFLFWILILSILCIENTSCQSLFLRIWALSFRVLCKDIFPNYQLESYVSWLLCLRAYLSILRVLFIGFLGALWNMHTNKISSCLSWEGMWIRLSFRTCTSLVLRCKKKKQKLMLVNLSRKGIY